ncbi:hypothetical protein K4749_01020 [Streptomyces sp. TRM72054]|uniref:hypothetical protein n=1 Tax=Streptomyces sp. TRM72054 TaxID=2870562 RepID=UPI001C8B0EEB|nr:hypothetical protein [Streptomyces sp. TRM72054]MBX9392211.1 hypothetical protein [Streptomyces sp. TRM72054]
MKEWITLKQHSTQLSAATALVQLLQEHPNLAAAEWSISSVIPSLRGFVFGGDMAALAAYADVLGGSIRASKNTHEDQGQRVRSHRLTTVWRDVPVEIVVALPVPVAAVAS